MVGIVVVYLLLLFRFILVIFLSSFGFFEVRTPSSYLKCLTPHVRPHSTGVGSKEIRKFYYVIDR